MTSSTPDTTTLLNAINATDRDVLSTQFVQSQALNDKTDILRDAMNNISRYTDNNINTTDRDVLKGNFQTVESLSDTVNNNSKQTNSLVSGVGRDVLTGHALISNELRDKIDTSTIQTQGLLAGIDKDIYTSIANQSHDIKADINSVSKDVLSGNAAISSQQSRDLFGLMSQTERQFFNNADRIDKVYADLKTNENAGFYNNAMGIKDTQRDIAFAMNNIEKHDSYLAHELYKELNHQDHHHERRHGDVRRDILRVDNEILRARLDTERQASQNFANVQIEALKNKDALGLQAANNLTAIQVEALKNSAALASKMAECCCEIKETVLSTASSTQGLIQNNEAAALRAQLQTEQTKNLILQTVDKH